MSEEKKNEILKSKVDTDEMEAVSGGLRRIPVVVEPFGEGDWAGNCSRNYYKEACKATIERGSLCVTNDGCWFSREGYTKVGGHRKASYDGITKEESDLRAGLNAEGVLDSCEGGADELL